MNTEIGQHIYPFKSIRYTFLHLCRAAMVQKEEPGSP